MNTRDKLVQLREIEARNAQRLEDWKEDQRKEKEAQTDKTTEKENGP